MRTVRSIGFLSKDPALLRGSRYFIFFCCFCRFIPVSMAGLSRHVRLSFQEQGEENGLFYKIADTCVECGACARVCPNAAIIKKEEA